MVSLSYTVAFIHKCLIQLQSVFLFNVHVRQEKHKKVQTIMSSAVLSVNPFRQVTFDVILD